MNITSCSYHAFGFQTSIPVDGMGSQTTEYLEIRRVADNALLKQAHFINGFLFECYPNGQREEAAWIRLLKKKHKQMRK
jgi:hypothetical protein